MDNLSDEEEVDETKQNKQLKSFNRIRQLIQFNQVCENLTSDQLPQPIPTDETVQVKTIIQAISIISKTTKFINVRLKWEGTVNTTEESKEDPYEIEHCPLKIRADGITTGYYNRGLHP